MNCLAKNRLTIMFFLFIAFSSITYANVVWPALYLEQRSLSWWIILTGLIIEFVFIKLITKYSLLKSAVIDISMNLASSLLGLLLIPIAGIAWEFFPGIVLYKYFNIGTFNPGTWTATFIFATLINAFIEKLVVEKIFKFKFSRSGFWLLVCINAITVGLAYISFLKFPPQS